MTRAPHSLPANERWKNRSGDVLALSLVAAAAVHFLVFQMWPEISVPDWTTTAPDTTVLIAYDTPLPVAPPELVRPAFPIPSDDPAVTATVPTLTFAEARELPPPPPPGTDGAAVGRGTFFPYDVAPRLANPSDFQRALLAAYPPVLRDAGLGGTVVLIAHISEEGRVLDARIGESSGYERLDEVALELVDVMRFTPALNRDQRVAVWVSVPIDFRIRR